MKRVILYSILSVLLLHPMAAVSRSHDMSLHRAVIDNDIPTVVSLIDGGRSINARDTTGDTPLHHACRLDRREIARLLIDRGADLLVQNNQGMFPIDYALANGDYVLVDMIKRGIVDRKTKIERIPMFFGRKGRRGVPPEWWQLDDKEKYRFGYFQIFGRLVIDRTIYKHFGYDPVPDILSWRKTSGRLGTASIVALAGSIYLGPPGLALSIPGIVCSSLGGYLHPGDYMRSGGAWFGVVGTVFLGLAGLCLLPLIVSGIVVLGLQATVSAKRHRILRLMNGALVIPLDNDY
jgi:hypothetical protein